MKKTLFVSMITGVILLTGCSATKEEAKVEETETIETAYVERAKQSVYELETCMLQNVIENVTAYEGYEVNYLNVEVVEVDDDEMCIYGSYDVVIDGERETYEGYDWLEVSDFYALVSEWYY